MTKISELPDGIACDPTDQIAVVQSGTTKRCTITEIARGIETLGADGDGTGGVFVGDYGAYIYQHNNNGNGGIGIRTGQSGSYKYFEFGVDGNFSTLNGEVVKTSGEVLQVETVQTRTKSQLTVPDDDTGTQLTTLDISITPKASGNTVILEWHINGEGTGLNTGFFVKRNGTVMANATDGANRWAITSALEYDSNQASTPGTTTVKIMDSDCLATATTYSVHCRATGGAALMYYVNRAVSSAGASQYENTLSTGTAIEVKA